MIVVGGEALIDMIMTVDGRFNPVAGGGPYNTARTLARLGHEVSFLGRLSDDWFGRMMRGHLEADGVDLGLVVETTDPSTIVLAEIDDEGVAHYRFYLPGTSAPGLDADAAMAALQLAPEAIHVGTLGLAIEPMADALAGLIAAAPPPTLVMIDPNCRPLAVSDVRVFRERMKRVLRRADVVKVSIEDLEYLALASTPQAAARAILAGGSRVVLLTTGPDAVTVFSARGTFDVPVASVPVVDTIGAGDAFGGGFLAHWLENGLDRDDLDDEARLKEAVRFGIRVSAITVGRAGANPPSREELARTG
jgi:fructokinase